VGRRRAIRCKAVTGDSEGANPGLVAAPHTKGL